MIRITQNICVKRPFVLSAGLLVNRRPLAAKFWGSQKSCTDFQLGWGQVGVPDLVLVKDHSSRAKTESSPLLHTGP